MKGTCFAAVGCVLVAALSQAAVGLSPKHEKARQIVIRHCAACHSLDEYYVTGRSRKGWELTVDRMRQHADPSSCWSDHDGTIIALFLATYCPEGVAPERVAKIFNDVVPAWESATGEAYADTQVEPPEPPAVASVAPAATARPPPRRSYDPDLPPFVRDQLEKHRLSRTPRSLHLAAKLGGYLAFMFVLLQIGTGHARRRLRPRFRTVHAVCATGLFLSMLPHAVVYLRKYGTPTLAWFAFGVLAFGVLVAAEMQGIVRKQFGRRFLRLHVAFGYVALALVVLHWIWIYVV